MSDHGFTPDPRPIEPAPPRAPEPTEPAAPPSPADREEAWPGPPAPPSAPPPPATAGATPSPIHDHGDDDELRDVEEIRKWILDSVRVLSPLELPLQEAHGCVLAGEVVAQLDLPPFSSSAMDGFAVRASDIAEATAQNPIKLRIVGRVAAGHPAEGT